MIERVIAHYERHGLAATQAKFPRVSVRHVISFYPHAPRRYRWSDEQVAQLARMAGLLDREHQAVLLGRPSGTQVKSFWYRKLTLGPIYLHAIPHRTVAPLLGPACPTVEVPFDHNPERERSYVLWVDLAEHLPAGAPAELLEAVRTMAQFQRLLFAPECPRVCVRRILDGRRRLAATNTTPNPARVARALAGQPLDGRSAPRGGLGRFVAAAAPAG